MPDDNRALARSHRPVTADLARLAASDGGGAQENARLDGRSGPLLREYPVGINTESRRQHKLGSG